MIENLTARLEKAELDEAQKQAVMAALDALEMAREGMEPEAFDAAMSALASLMMPEVPEEEPMDVDADEGPEPDMKEAGEEKKGEEEKGEEEKAEDEMDKEEVAKGLEELEKSEDFQALLKARDDELAELKKSLAEKDEAMTVKSYQEKAESFGNVPMAKDELAKLLRVVDGTGDDSLSESVSQLLSSVGTVMEKSDAFQEIGGSGDGAVDRTDAMGRIDALADGVVQKSEKPITREQAVARVLAENPALYTEWLNKG